MKMKAIDITQHPIVIEGLAELAEQLPSNDWYEFKLFIRKVDADDGGGGVIGGLSLTLVRGNKEEIERCMNIKQS